MMKARMSHYPGQEHQGRRTLVLDLDVPWHDLGCSCLGGIFRDASSCLMQKEDPHHAITLCFQPGRISRRTSAREISVIAVCLCAQCPITSHLYKVISVVLWPHAESFGQP